MICPKCDMEALQVDEHTEVPARRLCDPDPPPGKTWLRYHPCGHVVEKPVDLGHQDVETTAATYERFHLDRWVTGSDVLASEDLVEFLLARIDDRDRWAREALALCDGIGVTREWRWVRFYGPADLPKMPSSSAFYHGAPTPDEVLADCEAKRRIVKRCAPLANIEVRRQTRTLAGDTLCALALPYADHPDYREEWRP